jgi:putative transposase
METGETHRKKCRRYNVPGNAHELTFSCFRGRAFLSEERTCGYLVDAILGAKREHPFDLWAYVFMPEHVHLLICPQGNVYSIAAILRAIKLPVARRAMIYLRERDPADLAWLATGQRSVPYRFWQAGGGYDRNMTSVDAIVKAAKYIHENPVRRGLVMHAGQWRYSSARDWETGLSGLLPVDFDTFPRV